MNIINGLKSVGFVIFAIVFMGTCIMGMFGQLPPWMLIFPLGAILGLAFYSGAKK